MAPNNIVVVDERYCSQQQVQLVVREKLLCSRQVFTIEEPGTKRPWFKLMRDVLGGPHKTKKFLDAQGNILARVKEHPVAVPRRMIVQGSGFSFEVRCPY